MNFVKNLTNEILVQQTGIIFWARIIPVDMLLEKLKKTYALF